MKLKDMLVPLTLSLITLWGINYFVLQKQLKKEDAAEQLKPGQGFTAPIQQEMNKPLNRELSFEPYSKEVAPQKTSVVTSYGELVFTTGTGSLEQLTFKRMLSGRERVITTLEPSSLCDERLGFVVALDEKTPYWYALVGDEKSEADQRLTYQAEGPTAIIEKQFIVYNDVPKVDVRLTVKPKHAENGVQPRVFLPAPYVKTADKDTLPKGLVYTDRMKVEKLKFEGITNQFWFSPSLFGAEDRYFVNALVNDADGFARRAYFTGSTPESLAIILEGPVVKEAKTWIMSFYVGSKDAHDMEAVDHRLETTLDYGLFSPLIKLLLKLLKWLYSYVKNYGWAIIILSLMIQLIMVPLTLKGRKAEADQKEFQRKMQYVEQKYKNDPERLNAERMALTRKYGMSNITGCLPKLIPLPFLFCFNRLLSTSIELYQAPFIGWITDLSARDPYYILPVLSGAGILVQVLSDADMRKGITMLLVAAVVVAFTANFAAGLTLYLCASTWFALGQTYLQKRLKI